jgi:hypothetical protein
MATMPKHVADRMHSCVFVGIAEGLSKIIFGLK